MIVSALCGWASLAGAVELTDVHIPLLHGP